MTLARLILNLYIFIVCIVQTSALKMSTAVETDKMAALATAATEARGLAMDSIAAAHSGHMGLPLGCAEVGSILYGSQVCTVLRLLRLMYLILPSLSIFEHYLIYFYFFLPSDVLQPR